MNRDQKPVTRGFLRRRSAFAFGILLLAACLALWVTASGRSQVDRRDAVTSELDATLISLSQIARSFDKFVDNDGFLHRSAVRSDMRSLARKLNINHQRLRQLSDRGGFALATSDVISTPGLSPISMLEEVIEVAQRIGEGDQSPEMENRLGAIGTQLIDRLLPVYLRMKETESSARAEAGAAALKYGWAALAITIVALLAIIRFIHLPMERVILTAQARIAEGRRAAEAASEAKTQFLATMSHEIRTPMNGILGMAELMRVSEMSEKQRHMLDVICESGNALMVIIDDVLDLSKIEAGKFELERRPFDVAAVCSEVVRLFAGRAESKGVDCQLSIAPTDRKWTVIGDAKAVRQIVSNLVSNAIKFTEAGTVSVSLNDREENNSTNPMVEIVVRDDGIGIPAHAQARIFESFEQADASTTREYGGTGLGLSIVRKLVDAMDGTIRLQSEPGRGSEFTIRLPLETFEQPVVDSPRSAAPKPTKPILHRHVLIADDNDVNLMIATQLLEEAGCRVSQVRNGQEAVEMTERLSPDLVFMDGEMPVLDGLEATRTIRRRERRNRNGRVPIIALSANALADNQTKAIEAGMDGCVSKPFKPKELLDVLTTDWNERRS